MENENKACALPDEALEQASGGTEEESYRFIFCRFDFINATKDGNRYYLISEDVKTNDPMQKVSYTVKDRFEYPSPTLIGDEHTGSASALILMTRYQENGGNLKAYR